MKNKEKNKKADNGKKIIEEYIAFGSRKKVFWSITIATLILSAIGFPVLLKDQVFLKKYLIIWILEIIYIGLYVEFKRRKKHPR